MTYARFSAAPIGANLSAVQDGLLLVGQAANMSAASARLDMGKSAGKAGVEFAFIGADDVRGAIGVMAANSALTGHVGASTTSIGWRIHERRIMRGSTVLASNLPLPDKGEVLAVQVDFTANKLRFYRGVNQVAEVTLPAGTWHAAASLQSRTAGGLMCAVNSGQWPAATPAGKWESQAPAALNLRLADMDFISSPSDTPANARYEAVVESAGLETLDMLHFWPWGDAPHSTGAASLRLLDPAGRLDALVSGNVVGQPVNIRLAKGALAGAEGIGRYQVSAVDVDDDMRRTLHLADAHADLDTPLNPGVFLPNIPQLAWQPQPLVIGAVSCIPALPANSDNTVLYLADSRLAAVEEVRDRGDAMESGTWSLSPDGQQLLMQSPSLGPVVCNGSSIGRDAAGLKPAKLAEFLAECFRRIGKTAWSRTDVEAIDAATGYAGIGFASRDVVPAWAAISAALASYGVWCWRDGQGVLRFSRITAPETVADSVLAFDLDEAMLLRDVVRVEDTAPALSRRMAYRPNAHIHGAGDLVTDIVDVPPELRERLTTATWGVTWCDTPLPEVYRHADSAPPFVSLYWRSEDAEAELRRVLSIYSQTRQTWRWEVQDTSLSIRPGQVGRIRYARWPKLAAGRKVLVRAVQRNALTGQTTLTLWG